MQEAIKAYFPLEILRIFKYPRDILKLEYQINSKQAPSRASCGRFSKILQEFE
jgi:hypothetical protein